MLNTLCPTCDDVHGVLGASLSDKTHSEGIKALLPAGLATHITSLPDTPIFLTEPLDASTFEHMKVAALKELCIRLGVSAVGFKQRLLHSITTALN